MGWRLRDPAGIILKAAAGASLVSGMMAMFFVGSLFLNGSLSLAWGTLSSPNAQYLDGTDHMFQTGSWHLGNALRTWGETYGIKIDRFYFTVGVKHVNPRVSPKEANEED